MQERERPSRRVRQGGDQPGRASRSGALRASERIADADADRAARSLSKKLAPRNAGHAKIS